MDFETTFDVLSSPLRRNIIALLDESSPRTREELTEKLAAMNDGPDGARSDQPTTTTLTATRRRIRIRLHHHHLPHLADAGIIEFDSESVRATPELKTVAHSLPSTDVETETAVR